VCVCVRACVRACLCACPLCGVYVYCTSTSETRALFQLSVALVVHLTAFSVTISRFVIFSLNLLYFFDQLTLLTSFLSPVSCMTHKLVCLPAAVRACANALPLKVRLRPHGVIR
jgi:hypothetical protein